MPRVVLAGNNLAAVHVLELLLDALEPADVLVLAPPPGDRPDWQVSLADRAGARSVACLQPVDVNDAETTARVVHHDPDLLLSVYYTQVFRGALMAAIAGRAVNFHPSLLPRHRGNAPLVWAIVEGDRVTGITVHHIDPGIDTGNVIAQRELAIGEDETGYELHLRMAGLVGEVARDLVTDLVAGRPLPAGRPQEGDSSYHSARDPRVNEITWTDSTERIRNIVRALAPPLPGAYTLVDGTPVTIARVDRSTAVPDGPPGVVALDAEGAPVVRTGDGALRLTTVVVAGREAPGSALVELGRLGVGRALGSSF